MKHEKLLNVCRQVLINEKLYAFYCQKYRHYLGMTLWFADNATCEAIKPRDGAEVIFNCRFSFNVDSFSIVKNKSKL